MNTAIKTIAFAAALTLGTATAPLLAGTCSTGGHIQTKAPVAGKKDQFLYTLSYIDDASGDELITKVTAKSDKEALALGAKKC